MTQTEKTRRPGVRRSAKLKTQDSPALLEAAPAAAAPESSVPESNASGQTAPPKRGRPRKSVVQNENAAEKSVRSKPDPEGAEKSPDISSAKTDSPDSAAPKRGRGRPKKVAEAAPAVAIEPTPERPREPVAPQTPASSKGVAVAKKSPPKAPRKIPVRAAARPAPPVILAAALPIAEPVAAAGVVSATASITNPVQAPRKTSKASGAAAGIASAISSATAPVVADPISVAPAKPAAKPAAKRAPGVAGSKNVSREAFSSSVHEAAKKTSDDDSDKKSPARPKTSLLKGRTPERSAFKHHPQDAPAPVAAAPAVADEAQESRARRNIAHEKASESGNAVDPKPRSSKKNAMEQFYARAYGKSDSYSTEKKSKIFFESSEDDLPAKPQRKDPVRQQASTSFASGASGDSVAPQKSEAVAGRGVSGRSGVSNADKNPVAQNKRGSQRMTPGVVDDERSTRQQERADRDPERLDASGKASSRLPRPLRPGNSGRSGKSISSVYRPERFERSGEERDEGSRKNIERSNHSTRSDNYQGGREAAFRPERDRSSAPGNEFKDSRQAATRPVRESEPRAMRDADARSSTENGQRAGRGSAPKSSGDADFKSAKANLRGNGRQQKGRDDNFESREGDKDNRRGRISNWPTRPARPPKDGIKASSKGFVESWWGRSWLSSLEEALGHSTRLQRGRQYAKAGHVTQIVVEKCRVKATVCGNHVYHVHFRLSPLDFRAWSIVGRVLGSQAALAARLLNGELPEEINHGLARAGLSLIPDFGSELSTQCSCPDKSNPCKHIAAVHYLLAEEIDRDPFLLLCLRGKEREEVISLMAGQSAGQSSGRKSESSRQLAGDKSGRRMPDGDSSSESHAPDSMNAETGAPESSSSAGREVEEEQTQSSKRSEGKPLSKLLYAAPEPMPSIPDFFWGRILSIQPLPMPGPAQAPETPDALPRSLGAFPFWRGEEDLHQVLQEVYSKAAQEGLENGEEAKDEF